MPKVYVGKIKKLNTIDPDICVPGDLVQLEPTKDWYMLAGGGDGLRQFINLKYGSYVTLQDLKKLESAWWIIERIPHTEYEIHIKRVKYV